MKSFLKKIFYSKSFKKGMISALYANPRLTAAESIEIAKMLRAMDEVDNKKQETQKELKKAS